MQLNLGALANVSVAADPSGPQRSDFEFMGLSCAVQPLLFDGSVGRVLFKEYYEGGRSDVSECSAGRRITGSVNGSL